MSVRPPYNPNVVLMPAPIDSADPDSAGIAYYHTLHELKFYLRALQHISQGRMIAVVGLRAKTESISDLEFPHNVRVFLTSEANIPKLNETVGWYEPDPLRAVILAMTGRESTDGLILLFPHDWCGPSPETLVEKARRWRATPHSLNDDLYFLADSNN